VRRSLVVLAAAMGCSSPAVVPDAFLPSQLPERLSETGLYSDIATKQLAPGTLEFAPTNVLWSDAAVKDRWIQLPAGARIDSSDMDHWRFPVGTKLFKQFSLDDKRLETRVIWRIGDSGNREADTLVGAYVWDDAEAEATFAVGGANDLRGTDHDAPSAETCWRCHLGEPGNVLGFSALQLGDVSALPLTDLPAEPFAAPNSALGYLHANCGHCHNPNGAAWADSRMILRLDVGERDALATKIVQTTVGVPLEQWIGRGYSFRIVAGDPAASAIYVRMSDRTPIVQMPPIATEHPDPGGLAILSTWIQSL
jgi:hypothetical protein